MEPINGKTYTLWGQFVDRKEEWIGGTMVEMDRDLGPAFAHKEKITDISMRPNGTDSAMFCVHGETYEWSCDVEVLGISGRDQPATENTIKLDSRFGGSLTITKPCKTEN